jgi:CDP-glucose 4,6-dehydratase
MYKNFYRNKRVLVTGHTGFKGSWLSIWLDLMGAKVYGYSLKPAYNPNNYSLSGLSEFVTEKIADVRDYNKFAGFIKKAQPEIVFHLAAQPLVRISYKNPKETYETNIIGLVNILEILKNIPSVKSIVIITSDKCYRNIEIQRGYREDDRLGGIDPYSASKACAEIISESYYRSFYEQKGIGFATARAGNVIGGGDWSSDRLIPDCVKSLSKNKTIIIRNPDATRPWQHVLEPLSGYLLLGRKLSENRKNFSSRWNFGPEKKSNAKVYEIADNINKLWTDRKLLNINRDYKGLYESKLLYLNINKAKKYLIWKPVLDLSKSLNYTVNWYKLYYNGEINMKDVCLNQINDYISLAEDKNLDWTL